MQYTAIFHGCKNVTFQMKNYNISLVLLYNIEYGYMLEPPLYPCKPQFYYIKVGCKGVFVTRTCFRDVMFVQILPHCIFYKRDNPPDVPTFWKERSIFNSMGDTRPTVTSPFHQFTNPRRDQSVYVLVMSYIFSIFILQKK